MQKYTCENCHQKFESSWSEEDSLKDKEENFGDMPLEEMVEVCTECFNEIMNHAKEMGIR